MAQISINVSFLTECELKSWHEIPTHIDSHLLMAGESKSWRVFLLVLSQNHENGSNIDQFTISHGM